MTGDDLRQARDTLGRMWGLDRPLNLSELARVLCISGRDPGATIRRWEEGDGPTGPARCAIELMLGGAKPPGLEDRLTPALFAKRPTRGRKK